MKSELSFLMDLFLNEEVPTPIKKLVSARIKEVEKSLTERPTQQVVPRETLTMQKFVTSNQAPSMQRIIEAHPDVLPPSPVTPAAAQALQARAALLQRGLSEKPEPGRTSPRKI